MDAQHFIAEFGHIANAPGGVARLRELVLQLAISGGLVAHEVADTPVSASLESAAQQRRQYEKNLELRATQPQPAVGTLPFTIPAHWQWVRLQNLSLYIQRGKGPKYADRGKLSVVSQKCIQWSGFDTKQARFIADESIPDYGKERLLCGGDLLWNSTGTGTAGRIAIYPGTSESRLVADSHVTVIRLSAAALPRFIWCVIASPWIQARIQPAHPNSLVTGSTQQVELATSTARALPIPCPPTEEQSRIVAKVDELMALCDQLEAQQQARRQLQTTLRRATLQALASTQTPRDLQTDWSLLADSFGQLFSAPEDVTDLRATVLDLAILGRLTEQLSGDEPVIGLVDRCLAAKTKRLASGEMKRKTASATDVIQLEMDVPAFWRLVPLQDLFQFIDYRGQTPKKTESGVVLVTAKNVRPGRLHRDPVEYISEKSYKDWMTRGFPKIGDILFTTEAPLGNVALIETTPAFALAQRIIDLQPFTDFNTKCVMYFMMSPKFQALLERNSTGMTAKGIKAAKLKQLELPIPPAEAQTRIVERVEKFLRLCDDFEKQLRDANKLAERLAVASVATLTGIAIEQEEAPVKAPKTELFAPLHLGTPPGVKQSAPLASILARQQGGLNAKDLWQRYGSEIDAFYAQLKLEVANGWIREPELALVNEIHEDDAVSA